MTAAAAGGPHLPTHAGRRENDMPMEIDFTDQLAIWPERRDLWTNFRVPDTHTAALDAILLRHPRGFRSIPVVARVDGQDWETALFRYQDGSWSLPVSAAIRRRHHLEVGDEAQVHLKVVTG